MALVVLVLLGLLAAGAALAYVYWPVNGKAPDQSIVVNLCSIPSNFSSSTKSIQFLPISMLDRRPLTDDKFVEDGSYAEVGGSLVDGKVSWDNAYRDYRRPEFANLSTYFHQEVRSHPSPSTTSTQTMANLYSWARPSTSPGSPFKSSSRPTFPSRKPQDLGRAIIWGPGLAGRPPLSSPTRWAGAWSGTWSPAPTAPSASTSPSASSPARLRGPRHSCPRRDSGSRAKPILSFQARGGGHSCRPRKGQWPGLGRSLG